MAPKQMEMTSCDGCGFWQTLNQHEGLCRRRAPEAGYRSEEVARWPQTRGHQGCGDGSPKESATLTQCAKCVYWRQYNGGMHPMNRSDMPNSWWAHAGLCGRHAPKPTTEPGPRGFWRATSNIDVCGDGMEREVPLVAESI